ncbi:hypothetical protein VNI00_001096 [Paramarasmius palmivorus]|uniref:Uncharacterized protein n=1 Tax=Paramarasmius palmivorus TaxID=297713 RepID=A0AAW0E900_9AGAR
MSAPSESPGDLLTKALAANQAHQIALTQYVEKLTEELKEVDAFLARFKAAEADQVEDESLDHDIQIPGSINPKSPINPADLLKSESPFYEEAMRRQRYVNFISARPMKAKEHDALIEAVTNEFRRLKAIEHRERGLGLPDRHEPVDLNGDTQNINWSIVAEKVSDVSSVKRTPEECRVKWLGNKQPRLNHSEWKEQELAKLQEIVADRKAKGKVNWVEVAQALGTNRVPIDCMKNALERPRHNWTQESDKKLLEAVTLYGTNNWGLCALYVSEHCSPSQCQSHFTRSIDPQIKRTDWTADEDAKLLAAVATYGPSWADVCIFVPGRTNDQCRERYHAARQKVTGRKGGLWSREEDVKLLEGIKLHGTKWRQVSDHMEGTRSDSQCRTRFAKLQKAHMAGQNSSTASSSGPAVGASTAVAKPMPARAQQAGPSNAFLVIRELSNPPTPYPITSIPEPSRSTAKGKEKATPNNASEDPNPQGTPTNTQQDGPNAAKGKSNTRPKPKPVPKRKTVFEADNEPASSSASTAMAVDAESSTVQPTQERPKPKPIPKRKGPDNSSQAAAPNNTPVGDNVEDTSMDVDPASTPVPIKRKRGRPRKSETQPVAQQVSAPAPPTPISTPTAGTRQSSRLSAKRTSSAK